MSHAVTTNFKPPRSPHKKRKEKARDRRPGMDPKHLANVRTLPSCISGRKPCDPHHLKIKGERGVGLKATDRWAVPLTRDEHVDVEKLASKREEAWFTARGIACYELAAALWSNRHNVETMAAVLEAHRGKA